MHLIRTQFEIVIPVFGEREVEFTGTPHHVFLHQVFSENIKTLALSKKCSDKQQTQILRTLSEVYIQKFAVSYTSSAYSCSPCFYLIVNKSFFPMLLQVRSVYERVLGFTLLFYQKASLIPMNQHELKSVVRYSRECSIPPILLRLIQHYHTQPKTSFKFLKVRAVILEKIGKYSLFFWGVLRRQHVFKHLFFTAVGKRHYILRLYALQKIFEGKNGFKAFLSQYVLGKDSRFTLRHMPNSFHYRQALDPYQSDHKEIQIWFEKWEALALKERLPPFFLWLETLNRPDAPSQYIRSFKKSCISLLKFNDSLIYANGVLLNGDSIDFILDHRGDFYVSDSIKHMNFFDGAPIASAGEMTIKGGKILSINDNTGHYQIRISHFLQAIKLLNGHQVFTKSSIVSYTDTQKIIDKTPPYYTRIFVKNFLENPPFEPNNTFSIFKDGEVSLRTIHQTSPEEGVEMIHLTYLRVFYRKWKAYVKAKGQSKV
jgi:hypothetical protein